MLALLTQFVLAEQSEQLESLLQTIIEEKTQIPDAYSFINMGNFFISNSLYEAAVKEFEKALDVDPSNQIALLNLNYSLYKMNEYDQVLTNLNKLIDHFPDSAHAYYIMGLIYKDWRQLEEAIEYYEKVIELIPNHRQLNSELGQLYLDNDQLIKANERFMEMNYNPPRPPIMNKLIACQVNAYCYLHLGNYYREKGDLEKAQMAYQKATQFSNDKRSIALAYFYLGEIELKDHQYDRAIIEKKLAQKTYPLAGYSFNFDSFGEAFIEIGDIYYHAGNLPEAFKNYQLASDLANASEILAQAHYKKGLTYYRSQDYKNALREAETALSLNPDYLSDQERLIDLLIANSWSKITH